MAAALAEAEAAKAKAEEQAVAMVEEGALEARAVGLEATPASVMVVLLVVEPVEELVVEEMEQPGQQCLC